VIWSNYNFSNWLWRNPT